jgi:MFS family permease
MAVFFASECAASFISIVASAFVPPQIVIAFDQILKALACLLLLLVDHWPSILWVLSALAGFGIASTYGAGLLWFANIMPITGRESSVTVFGAESGGIVGPLIVGQLFDTVTAMSFVYTLIEAIIVQAGLFICMLAFGKLYINLTSGCRDTINEEKVIDSADSNGVSSPVEATHV